MFLPPYVSALIFELRQSVNDSSYYIAAFYKNNKPDSPMTIEPVTMGNCAHLCPLDEFMEIVKDKMVSDFKVACYNIERSYYSTNVLAVILIVVLIVVIVCIVLVQKLKRTILVRQNLIVDCK